ncbi:lethal(2) giant larvae protein homolog 1-like isoform X2 [Liolophura sinensis]|uniref:lethal(2) giant larvae protein homolog 1-like isoform X2 n=1 Tax=Liolophura sinensis TaxID=3198878 RepID=UPI0031587427
MFKFFRKSQPKESESREAQKKELFQFTKCVEHGFPSKPSALAYDPKLRLLAIGTKTGAVKIYGRPGVEMSGLHQEDVQVNQLFFLSEQGRLISLCSDNSLHLWEINIRDNTAVLDEVKHYNMESSKLKSISACCLSSNGSQLLLGTEGGNILLLDVSNFTLLDQIIYQDVVMQNVPDDFKINPGAVEAIAVHPTNPDKFLIGYNRGLIVLWDNKESNADKTYNATQQLESLTWHRNGTEFVSSHADGSYLVWSSTDSSGPKEPAASPYGPFPCKAISKILWKTAKIDPEPFIIFSGGMPRASYGDKHTVSVMQGSNHTVFDFTSRVIDFIAITRGDEDDTEESRAEHDDPHALIVLVDEELIVIDLDTPNWPLFRLPYVNSLHSTAITCSQHINNVPEQLWEKIVDAGQAQNNAYSAREWPITGGKALVDAPVSRDLLLTGHEDGAVRFWDASTTSLQLMYKLTTAPLFGSDVGSSDNAAGEEEEWPPFRKVGTFDPYSDDPRLAIQKIALCSLSETLIVAGTAGQVVILQMEREEREQEVKGVNVNIVGERDNFVWKGHEALTLKEGDQKFAPGFQPTCAVQLCPPAACTALAFQSEWQLVAAGTAHGFALFDYLQKKEVVTKCTLNPNDLTGVVQDTSMSRRKSFKKSLRESFRRLRRRRSERRRAEEQGKKEGTEKGIEQKDTTPPAEAGATASPTPAADPEAGAAAAAVERKPVERQVEARSTEDFKASLVRCLYFAETFVLNGSQPSATLWAGTNSGTVLIFTITLPASDKRAVDEISAVLAKEIKLRHHAPVISIAVLDKQNRVVPAPLEVQHERAKAPDMSGDHHVIICSEEQFKLFSLPHLKPAYKCKLTAVDGARVRRLDFVNFRSKTDENYNEFDIACLTNLGDLSVYSIPNLRRQLMQSGCIRKEDINGISSFIFTRNGQGFFLSSASEFVRVSLSAQLITLPLCEVELKEGMRPEPEPEPEVAACPEAGTPAIQVTAAEDSETTGAEGAVGEGETLEQSAVEDHNDSRADTTADITVDSVTVNPDVVGDTSTQSAEVVTTVTEVTVGGD